MDRTGVIGLVQWRPGGRDGVMPGGGFGCQRSSVSPQWRPSPCVDGVLLLRGGGAVVVDVVAAVEAPCRVEDALVAIDVGDLVVALLVIGREGLVAAEGVDEREPDLVLRFGAAPVYLISQLHEPGPPSLVRFVPLWHSAELIFGRWTGLPGR